MRTNGSRTITDQLILGLIDGVMTLLGMFVVVTPLALWAVPMGGIFANTAFYIVLSVFFASIIIFIGMSYLKGLLFPDFSSQNKSYDAAAGKARMQAYLTWQQTQDDARRAEKQMRATKGGLLHNFGYMVRIASLLITIVGCIFVSSWAFMHFYFGSTEILSEQERYNIIKKELNWKWKLRD